MTDEFKDIRNLEVEKLENESSEADSEVIKRKKKTQYVFAINDADEALDRLSQKKSGRF